MFQQNHTCFITLLSLNTMCDIHDPFVQKQTLLLQAPYDPFLTFIITTWASFIHQNLTLNLCDWTCNSNFMKKPEPASKPQITKPVLFHNCRNSTCTILLCNLSSNLYLGNVNSIQEAFATHTNSLLKRPLNLRFISATNCYSSNILKPQLHLPSTNELTETLADTNLSLDHSLQRYHTFLVIHHDSIPYALDLIWINIYPEISSTSNNQYQTNFRNTD